MAKHRDVQKGQQKGVPSGRSGARADWSDVERLADALSADTTDVANPGSSVVSGQTSTPAAVAWWVEDEFDDVPEVSLEMLSGVINHPIASGFTAKIGRAFLKMPANRDVAQVAALWLKTAPLVALRSLVPYAPRFAPFWTSEDLEPITSGRIFAAFDMPRETRPAGGRVTPMLNAARILAPTSWGDSEARKLVAEAFAEARRGPIGDFDVTGLGGYVEGDMAADILRAVESAQGAAYVAKVLDTILGEPPRGGIPERVDDVDFVRALCARLPKLDILTRAPVLEQHSNLLIETLGIEFVRMLLEQLVAEGTILVPVDSVRIKAVARTVGSPNVRQILGVTRTMAADLAVGSMLSRSSDDLLVSEGFAELLSNGAQGVTISEQALERLTRSKNAEARTLPILHAASLEIVDQAQREQILKTWLRVQQGAGSEVPIEQQGASGPRKSFLA